MVDPVPNNNQALADSMQKLQREIANSRGNALESPQEPPLYLVDDGQDGSRADTASRGKRKYRRHPKVSASTFRAVEVAEPDPSLTNMHRNGRSLRMLYFPIVSQLPARRVYPDQCQRSKRRTKK